MKTLCALIFVATFSGTLIAFATTKVSCDVRQWGSGVVTLDQKGILLVLKSEESDDFPVNLDWHSGSLTTPVGPVGVSYDKRRLQIYYDLVLGDKTGTIIGEGTREAKMTVFLGPIKGSNNGLTVSCSLLPPPAQPSLQWKDNWDPQSDWFP